MFNTFEHFLFIRIKPIEYELIVFLYGLFRHDMPKYNTTQIVNFNYMKYSFKNWIKLAGSTGSIGNRLLAQSGSYKRSNYTFKGVNYD